MKLDRKKISNLIFMVILILFFIPNTRGMMQIFLTRIFSFSPSLVDVEDRAQVSSYDWKLHGVNTSGFNFENAKGKVVVLNYWATWCPPCIAEMPSLQNLYDLYKEKEVVFLFVTNEVDEDIFKFMNAKKFTYPVYRSLGNDPKPFERDPIPGTYVLDKKGNVVIHKVGAADWDTSSVQETINSLLSE